MSDGRMGIREGIGVSLSAMGPLAWILIVLIVCMAAVEIATTFAGACS